MASVGRREWKADQLRRRVGHMDQLAGIKSVEGADGLERGNRVLAVWTGSGLEFQIQADRAMDIAACQYKGIALGWLSPVREAHPSHYEPAGLGWLRTFGGGLLATCGLDQFGAPSQDGDEELGLHGRISNLPARCLGYSARWDGEAYRLQAAGEVRQARLFGENLVLRRTISTELGAAGFRIEDVITNEGFAPHPHMILYHFNVGFPMLSEDALLHIDADVSEPRDAEAAAGFAAWSRFQGPTSGYSEQVFHHMPVAGADGLARIELANPQLGLTLRWTYPGASLPHLFQWKMMGEGAYVLGIEPANSGGIMGRGAARASEDLPVLEPEESRTYQISFEIEEASGR